MTKAREYHEMRSKLQVHGKRRGVPCRILQNPCKTNTIQCVAQARHAEAARLGIQLTKKCPKQWNNKRIWKILLRSKSNGAERGPERATRTQVLSKGACREPLGRQRETKVPCGSAVSCERWDQWGRIPGQQRICCEILHKP